LSPKLPVVSGREVVRVLTMVGYEVVRQRGSHMRLINRQIPERKPVTVPDHAEIGPGLLRKILRDAEISPGEFRKLLES
jgi:predicted RNA binding protein YcfA (HicA-like mRNA interferase family)